MLIDILKKIKNSSQGSTAIEFAFVLPIMIIFSFGFFEVCRIVYTQAIVSYSAEQATRYAMVNFQQSNVDPTYEDSVKVDIESFAYESLNLINTANISDFTVAVATDPATGTRSVSVNIDYDFTINIPMITAMNFTLSGQSDSFLIRYY